MGLAFPRAGGHHAWPIGPLNQDPPLHAIRGVNMQQGNWHLAFKVGIAAAAALLARIAIWTLKLGANPVSDGIVEQGFSPDPFYLFSKKCPIEMKCLEKTGLRNRCFNGNIKNLSPTNPQELFETARDYLQEFKSKAEALRLDFVTMLRIKPGDPIASRTIPYQLSQSADLTQAFDYLFYADSKNITAASQMLGEILSSGEWSYNSEKQELLYFSMKMFRDYKLYLKENPHLLPAGNSEEDLDVYDDVHIFLPKPFLDAAYKAFQRAVKFGSVEAMLTAAAAFHRMNNTIEGIPDPREREFLEMAAEFCDRGSQLSMFRIHSQEGNRTAADRYFDLYRGDMTCTPPAVPHSV